MSRERRLGRGLEALLGRSIEPQVQPGEQAEQPAGQEQNPVLVIEETNSSITRDDQGQQWLLLGSIDANPYQPRVSFDETEIADLCDSIRTHGFLQPIVVRPVEDRFQLIAGERRLRAAQLAGWERVPVQVRKVEDRQMAELAIVENVQRKDLNAIEKARSFQRYLQEYGCTQEELAERVSVDRSTVANLIRLLELPEAVKQMVVDGQIAQGHARALLPLGEEPEQVRMAERVRDESLSVRAVEQMVQEHIREADAEPLTVVGSDGTPQTVKKPAAPHLADLEEQLRMALGTRVELRQTAKGKGRITIHFKDQAEFERLREHLTGPGRVSLEAA